MKQKSLEIRNSAKFGKIRFVTEFEKWHSGSEFEEQNSAVCSNIRQHSPTSNLDILKWNLSDISYVPFNHIAVNKSTEQWPGA